MADATPTTTGAPAADATARRAHPAHSALVGLTSLGVLLQGLWAGLFLGGSDDPGTWRDVHEYGADATVTIAALATIAAFVWLRHRIAVLVGTTLLFVLLVVEMLLGMAESSWAIAVHVPLALILMGLAVWLPTQARR